MQKSNWIIVTILVVASILFLWMWQALQFSLVDNPVDIVVTVVWWLVIAGACVAIHWAEKKRRERIRTVFLAQGLAYNCETGVVRLDANASVVDALQNMLNNLNYGFDLAELPSNSRVRFQRIVRTSKFADNGNVWEGELVEVVQPGSPKPFSSRSELAHLMGEC